MGMVSFAVVVVLCIAAVVAGIRDLRSNGVRWQGLTLLIVGLLVLAVYLFDIAISEPVSGPG